MAAFVETLLDAFHERTPIRAGSLIVTVFGDAVVPRGGVLSLSSLHDIMRAFRISDTLVQDGSVPSRQRRLVRALEGRAQQLLPAHRPGAGGFRPGDPADLCRTSSGLAGLLRPPPARQRSGQGRPPHGAVGGRLRRSRPGPSDRAGRRGRGWRFPASCRNARRSADRPAPCRACLAARGDREPLQALHRRLFGDARGARTGRPVHGLSTRCSFESS